MKASSAAYRSRALAEMGLAPPWTRRDQSASAPESRDGSLAERVRGIPDGAAPDQAQNQAATAHLDWSELAVAVEGCRACSLGSTRKQAVLGVGAARPVWLFVGEAPGAEEDERGEPFVGEAGRLLDNMLRALGIARGREVYIANVIKCRPPRNRNPEPEEIARCSPYLWRQIGLLEPEIIVALGRFAAQTLLQSDAPVGSLRGRTHRIEIQDRAYPIVVTYHPAYLLRNLQDKQKAWIDLCLARKALDEARSPRGAA